MISDIKQISSDIKIFILHAGKGRKFFNTFKQNQIVFLNIPDFDLTQQDLKNTNALKNKVAKNILMVKI